MRSCTSVCPPTSEGSVRLQQSALLALCMMSRVKRCVRRHIFGELIILTAKQSMQDTMVRELFMGACRCKSLGFTCIVCITLCALQLSCDLIDIALHSLYLE